MNVSRRWFIGGAASFGALQGCKVFRDPAGLFGAGRPNLRFGVISDIHIIAQNVDKGHQGNTRTLEHAFRWFDAQGVDGVMIAGDMADAGLVSQLQCVADAWYKVFPNDEGADGRHVEKLFVYGNHDWEGCFYGYDIYGKKSGDLTSDHIRRFGMKKAWERIFNEEYTPIYRKTVKGYDFIGAHWDGNNGMFDWGGSKTVEKWFAEHGKSLDPKLPFFYFQHPHPKDTCYGSWAWGHDSGKVTKALSAYANAVAFSGHSHYTLTDERSLWQGAFTSVGTSSLRYTGMPYNARMPLGYENTTTEGKQAAELDALKVLGRFADAGDCRQGMVWNIYDDRIVVQRREFLNDVFVGPDWVMPLTTAEAKPFEFASRAKKAKAPEFAKDAKIVAQKVKAKTRATAGHPAVEKDAVAFDIPPALAVAGARPHEFEILAKGAEGKTAVFHVVANGFNHALSHKRASAPTPFKVALDRLPAGTTALEVRPLDCWWNKGAPLVVEI